MAQKKHPKNFLYIGGSKPQIPGIYCVKEAGLDVVVTDRSFNAPARTKANKFVNIAADDTKKLLELALKLDKENGLAAAYGVADYAYSAIGEIYDKLKLPYGSKFLYEKMANKNLSREIWKSNSLRIPKGILVSNENSKIPNINYPIVVKPANSFNSQGLKTVYKPEELKTSIKYAFEFSENIVLEEFIDGRHFNIDMVFIDGEAFRAGITERFFLDAIDHQALSGIQGLEFKNLDASILYNLVIKACKAIGFNYGPVTADIIIKNNKPYILEISPHFHAISISSLINLENILKGWFKYISRDKEWRACMQINSKEYAGYFYILSNKGGDIVEIEGLDYIKSMPSFVGLDMKYEIGSTIKKNNQKQIYCGMATFKSNTYSELYDNFNSLSHSVSVVTNEP